MSDIDPEARSQDPEASQEPESRVDRGTYEIIRDRLVGHGDALYQRTEALNKKRLELFGGSEFEVLGNARIRTENNCVPRDIVSVGGRLLFGYQVFIGMKTETKVNDVFSLHEFKDDEDGYHFPEVAADAKNNFLADPKFVEDFRELYQYYKNARLLQLRRPEGKLLAVFRIGEKLQDIRVFRWAVDVHGNVLYIDNRGDRDHTFPSPHDFEWTPTGREDHVAGSYPHVTIADKVFVETVGGDLTVKVENNTESGAGVYSEPVVEADQSLDDADIQYAELGTVILLKVLPYRETEYRYLVYNTRTHGVNRIDAIGQACVQLPEDHGLIFPGGYYLQSGETKSFDADVEGMEYLRMFRSPNGEDVLYVFHQREHGQFILLPYNMIRKEITTPIICHGYSRFGDGRVVVFRGESEDPTRVHMMQVWSTPFMDDDQATAAASSGSFLEKVGNPDLVRGVSDCLSIRRMVNEQTPTRQKYEDLISATARTIDNYYWLDHQDTGPLKPVLSEIQATAELIIDEFEKVEALRAQAREALVQTGQELQELFRHLTPDAWTSVDNYVEALTKLRSKRGHLITLKEMRYIDLEQIDALEAEVVERYDELSHKAVEFLLGEEALAPYREQIDALEQRVEGLSKVTESDEHRAELETLGNGLNLLTEIVGSLDVEDATQRTQILEQISELMGGLNRVRALGQNRRTELLEKEGVAEFAVQFQLLGQSVTSSISLADTPEKCDRELSKVMLQLEELESRFSEFDGFIEQLTTKREEIYDAFGARKQTLLEKRQRRAENLMRAAERILTGVVRRAEAIQEVDDLNAFFASDAMVAKLRATAVELRELGDSVHADEVEARLKSSKEDAARGLKDRKDIYEDGTNVIRLGRHRFSVNNQPLELTMVPRDGDMAFHLTGTSFYETIDDEGFNSTKSFWSQEIVSENPDVYRGEFLASSILNDAIQEERGLSFERLQEATLEQDQMLALVRDYAAERYDEGYERGIHDADGARILTELLSMRETAGLLRFTPGSRAMAALFWVYFADQDKKRQWAFQAASLSRLRDRYKTNGVLQRLSGELAGAMSEWLDAIELAWPASASAREAGEYLAEEIARDPNHFVLGAEAEALKLAFEKNVRAQQQVLEEELKHLVNMPARSFRLLKSWLSGYLASRKKRPEGLEYVIDEAAVAILTERALGRESSNATTATSVSDLLGQHPRIEGGTIQLRIDELLARLGRFRSEAVPAYREYQKQRHEVLEQQKERLRIDEFRPKVMSSFVRNKLINDVYLPLIGDNLAKQMGTVGADKRTDLMGLLLLVSPPGYGKTTLMEYIANRLGLVFMKINGPALGHSVTSLDPSEAPNATARQEVEKLNLAFEMGNNVLLYVDDIQHTHPEFLQKFISLCDAQRRIEGVWQGRTRTYDLRGKKFCVCMAGNPYTESGEKFQIPDMLANRADTYNLGDILEGRDEQFALSYIENSLTSNSILAPLTTREQEDVYKLVRIARGEPVQADELSHEYSAVELGEIRAVLEKLLRAQDLLLRVNQQYILSASQQDAYRTEPPFRLQGSYRNMNKLAEKIVPAMNEEELESLIDDHYASESQTLTTGAEENLLKLAEMRGRMTDEQSERWQDIKKSFMRNQRLGSSEDDPATRLTGQLSMVSDHLEAIGESIDRATEAGTNGARLEAPAPLVADPDLAPTPPSKPEEPLELKLNLEPYLEKLHQLLEALQKNGNGAAEKRPSDAKTPPADYELISREAYLIEGTLIPLLRFMAHRFKGYRGVDDPKLKQLIATLEFVDDVPELVEALEKINVSAISGLTEDNEEEDRASGTTLPPGRTTPKNPEN